MDISSINLPAVIAAALLNFLLGGLWYSPILFGKRWAREAGLAEEALKPGLMRIFGFAFAWSVAMSFNLAMFLNDSKTTTQWGAIAGFLAGFGWVAMAIFIIGLFERKTTAHMLINAGYMTISFVLMGLLLGAWR
jgi:hypothetical protein